MLLGKDCVIKAINPAFTTDALVRKVNVDRYDDRDKISTNLIESYDRLMAFASKHLWDKFYLEKDISISLRDRIAREILVNTLIHREMTSSYVAKFVIEKNKMYTENACRAQRNDLIDDPQGGTQGGTQYGTQNVVGKSFLKGDDIILRILELINKNNTISRQELATELGVSVRTIQRHIKSIDNIRYVGSGYSGHWEIRED